MGRRPSRYRESRPGALSATGFGLTGLSQAVSRADHILGPRFPRHMTQPGVDVGDQ